MSTAAADLSRWEIPNRAVFDTTAGGLPRLVITTPLATAHVFLQGAHVTHFQPTGTEPLLFTSAQSFFAAGKAIRGGVPVIFPWFGPRDGVPGAPMHGFARTSAWAVEALACAADDVITATFRLDPTEAMRSQWPHEFALRLRLTVGRQLEMALEVENRGGSEFRFEEALHTYLAVGDVREAATTGLAGAEFIDKVDAFARKRQDAAPIHLIGETDRVYLNTSATCVVEDPVLQRRVVVEKSGSETTVVWNPWLTKAAAMADFGDDDWQRMLCIETANAGDNAIVLAPGAKHTMLASIGHDPL